MRAGGLRLCVLWGVIAMIGCGGGSGTMPPDAGAGEPPQVLELIAGSIGGFGNVEGTILAGLLVGLNESYTTQYLDPGLIDIVVFGLLLLMLAFRPTGLISERREENV